MLSTIQSPALRIITVPITSPTLTEEDDEITLPVSDWRGVDAMLCDLLTRVRRRTQDPLWTFKMRLTGCEISSIGLPFGFEIETPLPDFRAMGGLVVLSSSHWEA